MVTIKDLLKFLEKFPDETEIEVIEPIDDYNYLYDSVPANLDENCGNVTFYDFTKNESVREDHPYYMKKILTFGEI